MDLAEKLFRQITGKTPDEAFHLPQQEESLRLFVDGLKSRGVRQIGISTDGGVVSLTEEDRESHIHVLGSPGEGKSKFLEMMVSLDIDALISGKSKSGACLIDSSDNGETMMKVLSYCVKRNFTKVCVIDPSAIHDFGFVPCINPIRYSAPTEAVEGHLMDSVRVLWGTKDFSAEARISKFLPRIFRALHAGQFTLPDSECFTIQELATQRGKILASDKLDLPTRLILERVYKTRYDWSEFESTARRLNPFYTTTMKLMFGSRVGMDFRKLITEGWVILANLYPGDVFGEEQQRLVGTVILNELIVAMSRLRRPNPVKPRGYTIPYYIYIDEVGHYATRKLSDILDYKRKSGFRLTIAHQRFDQIEDKTVLSAIKSSAKSKVLFYTANPDDRLAFVKMMYGGELTDREVSYALSQTKKQNAVIKINKQPPVSTRLRDWPDAQVDGKAVADFLQKLYTSNPQLYRPVAEVWGEIKTRFAVQSSPAGAPPKERRPPGSPINPQRTTGEQSAKPGTQPDKPKPKRKSIFDNLPDS
jgi:hypothetical protein